MKEFGQLTYFQFETIIKDSLCRRKKIEVAELILRDAFDNIGTSIEKTIRQDILHIFYKELEISVRWSQNKQDKHIRLHFPRVEQDMCIRWNYRYTMDDFVKKTKRLRVRAEAEENDRFFIWYLGKRYCRVVWEYRRIIYHLNTKREKLKSLKKEIKNTKNRIAELEAIKHDIATKRARSHYVEFGKVSHWS